MFQIKFKNSLITLLGLVAFALFAAPAYSQDKVLVTNTTSAAKITANLNTPTGALGGLFLIGYLAPEE